MSNSTSESNQVSTMPPPDPANFPATSAEGGEQDEVKKPDLSGRIFFAVVGLIALLVVVGAGLVFYVSVSSASGLGDLAAYPGAGYVKVPDSFTNQLKTDLKPLNLKAEIELGLAHDDLGKVQAFYASSMKEKGYEAGAIAPVQGGQLSGLLRSFGNGIKVSVYSKKDAPFHFVIASTLSEKTSTTANSELGLKSKPGDVLIMLVKLQNIK